MGKNRTIMDLDNFTYTDADGVVYDYKKMYEISKAYGVMCTAEYINDLYDISIEEAFNASEEIRDIMQGCCECESEIIDEFRLDRHWRRPT